MLASLPQLREVRTYLGRFRETADGNQLALDALFQFQEVGPGAGSSPNGNQVNGIGALDIQDRIHRPFQQGAAGVEMAGTIQFEYSLVRLAAKLKPHVGIQDGYEIIPENGVVVKIRLVGIADDQA